MYKKKGLKEAKEKEERKRRDDELRLMKAVIVTTDKGDTIL